MRKKVKKILHTPQQANMRAFYAKQKQSNLSKVDMPCSGHLAFADPFQEPQVSVMDKFDCISLTVLSKLIFNISKKLSNHLQIPGYLLHFITTIIGIIIFRQVDNKRLNFIIKHIVHDTKLLSFFIHVVGIIYPIFSGKYFSD